MQIAHIAICTMQVHNAQCIQHMLEHLIIMFCRKPVPPEPPKPTISSWQPYISDNTNWTIAIEILRWAAHREYNGEQEQFARLKEKEQYGRATGNFLDQEKKMRRHDQGWRRGFVDRGNHSISGSKTSFESVGSFSPHDNPFPDTSICQHSNTKEVQGVANSISIEHPHSVCKMSRKQCPTLVHMFEDHGQAGLNF